MPPSPIDPGLRCVTGICVVASFLVWFIRSLVPQDRIRFVNNHLRRGFRFTSNLQPGDGGNDGPDTVQASQTTMPSMTMVRRFTNHYLRHDGVFLLRLIAHNTNGITTTEITRELWDLWIDREPPLLQGQGIEASNELSPLHEKRSSE